MVLKELAVIGSGISGLVAAHLLSRKYKVTLFESNDYLGGHTNTLSIQIDNQSYAIDTGFIVFNQKTYPNFCSLLKKLNVAIQPSEMSFSYHAVGKKLEYNGHSLNTLFSDRHNLINPYFYRFLIDILKFNYDAKKFIKQSPFMDISIQEFLDKHHYSENFTQSYLLPMIGSVWSKNKNDILKCSAYFILKFYANHGLLDLVNRPPWYVIAQGSKSYIEPLVIPFKERIYLNTGIEAIDRHDSKVILHSKTQQFSFDSVVIATHSDQALKLLSQPTQDEMNILSAIRYTLHEVILHTDENVMPKRKRSWASWNYLDRGNLKLSLTYYMNRLQSLKADQHFFVSLNLEEMIDQKKIIKRIKYEHPCLDITALNAQQQIALINGKKNTYYVGSYWGYGFHEDGVKSALDTCRLLGVENV